MSHFKSFFRVTILGLSSSFAVGSFSPVFAVNLVSAKLESPGVLVNDLHISYSLPYDLPINNPTLLDSKGGFISKGDVSKPLGIDLGIKLVNFKWVIPTNEPYYYYQIDSPSNPGIFSYTWTRDAVPVPEPLTIPGLVAALGFGAIFKRQHSKRLQRAKNLLEEQTAKLVIKPKCQHGRTARTKATPRTRQNS